MFWVRYQSKAQPALVFDVARPTTQFVGEKRMYKQDREVSPGRVLTFATVENNEGA
jgi:hypothetical protein